MATKIIFQDPPWGFSEVRMNSLTIYCGKVKLKGIEYTGREPYLNAKHYNGYCTLSFEVIDRQLANHLFRVIGKLCRDVAQYKLEEKWKWLDV